MVFLFTVGFVCLFLLIGLSLFSIEFREAVSRFFRRIWYTLTHAFTTSQTRAKQSAQDATQSLKNIKPEQLQTGAKQVARHPFTKIALTTLIISAPLAWAYYYTQHGGKSIAIVDFGKDDYLVRDDNIANLLAGERLEPPPPPPAELFEQLDAEIASYHADMVDSDYWNNLPAPDYAATVDSTTSQQRAEAIRNDKTRGFSGDMLRSHLHHGHINIKNANRNWKKMNSGFVQRLLRVFKVMKDEHGYEMILLEGYRSPQRQNRLLGKGKHVTKAGGYRSYHQFGLAADAAFLRNGKIFITEKDPWAMRGYKLYGQVAKQHGLVWGGDWRMRDLGHVELRKRGVLGKPHMAKILTQQ